MMIVASKYDVNDWVLHTGVLSNRSARMEVYLWWSCVSLNFFPNRKKRINKEVRRMQCDCSYDPGTVAIFPAILVLQHLGEQNQCYRLCNVSLLWSSGQWQSFRKTVVLDWGSNNLWMSHLENQEPFIVKMICNWVVKLLQSCSDVVGHFPENLSSWFIADQPELLGCGEDCLNRLLMIEW